jgi:hypothetical protein
LFDDPVTSGDDVAFAATPFALGLPVQPGLNRRESRNALVVMVGPRTVLPPPRVKARGNLAAARAFVGSDQASIRAKGRSMPAALQMSSIRLRITS